MQGTYRPGQYQAPGGASLHHINKTTAHHGAYATQSQLHPNPRGSEAYAQRQPSHHILPQQSYQHLQSPSFHGMTSFGGGHFAPTGPPYSQLIRTPSGGFEQAIPTTGSRFPPQYTPFGLTAKRKRAGINSSQADAGVAAILGLSGWSSKPIQRTLSHSSISSDGSNGGGSFSSQGFAPGFGRMPSGSETSSPRAETPQPGGERKRKANQLSLRTERTVGTSRATDPAATATVALAVATAAAVAPGGVSAF